jgi:hypothetical protein
MSHRTARVMSRGFASPFNPEDHLSWLRLGDERRHGRSAPRALGGDGGQSINLIRAQGLCYLDGLWRPRGGRHKCANTNSNSVSDKN